MKNTATVFLLLFVQKERRSIDKIIVFDRWWVTDTSDHDNDNNDHNNQTCWKEKLHQAGWEPSADRRMTWPNGKVWKKITTTK